ncbi:MAG: fumarylacetoacetate hydrolase family protein [Anaerolineae bacterium]|nr:fumarylacetoacetate hydrolase family protein [Anaerolineae bacterium]
MKVVRFTHRTRTQLGMLDDEKIYALSGSDTMSMMDLLRRGITPNRVSLSFPLAECEILAPVPRPGKIIAIGRNYVEHAKETGSDVPKAPIIFAKFPSSIIGPDETITWSKSIAQEVDWEGELAVVIGKRGHNISEDDAYNHIYGYTIANDVSARDLQLRVDTQWTRGKSLDTFCPMGPYLVTRDEVKDPQKLKIKTMVNNKTMQNGNTKDMIFSIAYLISYCSQMFTLEPGDILLTGTPPGVGEGMDPKQYLQDGDIVKITIDGLGELSNPVKVTD